MAGSCIVRHWSGQLKSPSNADISKWAPIFETSLCAKFSLLFPSTCRPNVRARMSVLRLPSPLTSTLAKLQLPIYWRYAIAVRLPGTLPAHVP
jgi:hypothetical protein